MSTQTNGVSEWGAARFKLLIDDSYPETVEDLSGWFVDCRDLVQREMNATSRSNGTLLGIMILKMASLHVARMGNSELSVQIQPEAGTFLPPEMYLESLSKCVEWTLEGNECRHSEDFSSVIWYGTKYEFALAQSAIVAKLWGKSADDRPTLRKDTLLDSIPPEAPGAGAIEVSQVFRGHPAWKTMIISPRRGIYRLSTREEFLSNLEKHG